MQDIDPQETQEWLSALESVVKQDGPVRAKFILDKLTHSAREAGVSIWQKNTPYCNTITVNKQPQMVGDAVIEQRIRGLVRWNAMAMVVKAQQVDSSLGGHIAHLVLRLLYMMSVSRIFLKAQTTSQVEIYYILGHASPGIYARSYLLGEISEDQLIHFIREVDKKGVSSYPHPWLMPKYWQFPTVSMGLGPIQAIYQARYIRYLENRHLIPASNRKVWCFCGDGEMDEPESVGALTLPVRENLDNLIFVINCNLQRLDGPVRGNGKIIQELEALFAGAGWNVIKTIWGKGWDKLFAKDKSGLLQQRMEEALDGEYQNYKAKGGSFTREHFFGKYDEFVRIEVYVDDASGTSNAWLGTGTCTVSSTPDIPQFMAVDGAAFQQINTVSGCSGQQILLDMGGFFGTDWTFKYTRPDGAIFPGGTNGVMNDQIVFTAGGGNSGTWKVTYTSPSGCLMTKELMVNSRTYASVQAIQASCYNGVSWE